MGLCVYCETGKTINCKICPICKPIYEEKQQKECNKCSTLKDWKDFHTTKKELFGLTSKCKICHSVVSKNYQKKLEPFMTEMFKHCSASAEKHILQGRVSESDFTLTKQHLLDKYANQKQRCAISYVTMGIGTHIDFKASPERLNNDLTYTDENLVLIIAELNTRKQITRPFLLQLCNPNDSPHPQLEEINALLLSGDKQPVKYQKHPPLQTKTIEGELSRQCVVCTKFVTLNLFPVFKNGQSVDR